MRLTRDRQLQRYEPPGEPGTHQCLRTSRGGPVKDVLEPMAVNLIVGLGDQPRKVRASLRAGGQP